VLLFIQIAFSKYFMMRTSPRAKQRDKSLRQASSQSSIGRRNAKLEVIDFNTSLPKELLMLLLLIVVDET